MNYKIPTAGAIIVGLVIYILYLQQCTKQPKQSDNPAVLSVDTQAILKKYQVVTHPGTDTVYRPGAVIYPDLPKAFEVDGSKWETVKDIPVKVDTEAIIRDYYSLRIKKDSFITRGARINLTDSVYNNDIIGRQWDVQVYSETVTKTVAPAMVYFGGGFYNSKTILFSGGHLDLGYINRKGQHFKVDILRMNGQWHKGVTFYQPLWRIK